MKRLLALVVAVGLVAVALYVRSNREDEDADDPVATPTTRVTCATEFGALCRALGDMEVTIEDASVTFERLTTTADPELGAWLTFDPWPEMVDEQRESVTLDRLFDEEATPLARSRLAAVGPDDLGACGWRCLGDRSNTGELQLGLPEPTGGLGLLIVGAFTAGYFGEADIATNDFDQAFEDWLSSLVALVRVDPSPVRTILLSQALLDVALSTDQDASRQFGRATPDRKEGLALLYPEPVASVDVVLAGATDALAGTLTDALTAAGWSPPDPDTPTGLPSAGVLLALRLRL